MRKLWNVVNEAPVKYSKREDYLKKTMKRFMERDVEEL